MSKELEEIKVAGTQLVEEVRRLIKDGSASRLTIKRGTHVYMEIPLSVGLGGAMAAIWLAPTLAAVGAIAALVTDVELVVERDEVEDAVIVHEDHRSNGTT
ncbi:MAG: DUF4342 domain-containing protein [Bacteroidota bacterium]